MYLGSDCRTGPEDPPRWKVEAHNRRRCGIGELRMEGLRHLKLLKLEVRDLDPGPAVETLGNVADVI